MNAREYQEILHLTAEQIDDHLIGDLAPESAAHLDSCNSCKARVAEAEAPLASFQAVTLAWSERRSATLPLHSEGPQRTQWPRRLAWASTLAIALAVGLAIPLTRPAAPGSPGTKLAQAPAVVASPAVAESTAAAATTASASTATKEDQIAQDNRMLAAIDCELDVPVVSPAAFGLNAGSSRGHGGRNTTERD